MKLNRDTLWFLAIFALSTIVSGTLIQSNFPPYGMHQGAQADRACIALNYFQESMNFFLPRVMENRAADGICGLEFPILPYITACLYKVFGFHDVIYRLLLLTLWFFGQRAAWKMSSLIIPKLTHRAFFHFLWTSSPLLFFYSFNFLPDIAALSFSLIAWHHFFEFKNGKLINHNFHLFLLFSALSGLLKVTFLINFIAAIIIQWKQLNIPSRLKLLLPVLAVGTWYFYSAQLTKSTYNLHFLQQMNPPSSMAELIENSRYALDTWMDQIYPRNFLLVFVIIMLISAQQFNRQSDLLKISGLLFGGFLSVFLLFNRQFRFHDYYFIQAFPFIFFGLLYLYETHLKNKLIYTGLISILALVGLFITPFYQFSHAKNIVRRTLTPKDYYNQSFFQDFTSFEKTKRVLDSIDPTRKKEIIFAFDPTPNTSLYLLQRQGIRLASDFDSTLCSQIIQEKLKKDPSTLQYLIIQDLYSLSKNHFIRHFIAPQTDESGLKIYTLKNP